MIFFLPNIELFLLPYNWIHFFFPSVEFIFQVNCRQQCNEDVQITAPTYRYYCISFHCHCFCSNSIKLLMGTLFHQMTQFDWLNSLQIFFRCRMRLHFIDIYCIEEMKLTQSMQWDERCKIINKINEKSEIKFSPGKIIWLENGNSNVQSVAKCKCI